MSTSLSGGTSAGSNSHASVQRSHSAPQRRAAITGSPLMVARIRADRACAAVNWILLAASLGIGFYFGNGLRVLVAGLPLAIASTVMAFAMPGHLTTRLVSAITFMGSAALMIDVGHGQDKFHFVLFILLSLLLAYRDVRVILLATAVSSLYTGRPTCWLARLRSSGWIRGERACQGGRACVAGLCGEQQPLGQDGSS